MDMVRRVALVAVSIALAVPAGSQDRPLPELQPFMAEARKHVKTDDQLLSQYTFRERRRELHVTKFGKLATGALEVFEVYPGVPPVRTYRRLVEVDGRPRNATELEREDREHRRKIEEAVAKREKESASDRANRLERRQKAQQQFERAVDDLFRVYTFTMVGRQTIDGHPAIAIDFAPKPGARPTTDGGKLMLKVKGRAWISESDYQIARVDAEVMDDVSYGLGVLGKLYKGTKVSFERRKINNEVWLPSEVRINAQGRAFIRKFQLDTVIQYSDYRKFGVGTDTRFALPDQ